MLSVELDFSLINRNVIITIRAVYQFCDSSCELSTKRIWHPSYNYIILYYKYILRQNIAEYHTLSAIPISPLVPKAKLNI